MQKMTKHLAIMSQEIIDEILAGKKTIETRFSQKRIAPFGAVRVGDTVYMKPPGKEIIGQFHIKKVICFEGLDQADVTKLLTDYGKGIGPWQVAKGVKFATLIFIADSERFITSPIRIKKSDQRGWMVLD